MYCFGVWPTKLERNDCRKQCHEDSGIFCLHFFKEVVHNVLLFAVRNSVFDSCSLVFLRLSFLVCTITNESFCSGWASISVCRLLCRRSTVGFFEQRCSYLFRMLLCSQKSWLLFHALFSQGLLQKSHSSMGRAGKFFVVFHILFILYKHSIYNLRSNWKKSAKSEGPLSVHMAPIRLLHFTSSRDHFFAVKVRHFHPGWFSISSKYADLATVGVF